MVIFIYFILALLLMLSLLAVAALYSRFRSLERDFRHLRQSLPEFIRSELAGNQTVQPPKESLPVQPLAPPAKLSEPEPKPAPDLSPRTPLRPASPPPSPVSPPVPSRTREEWESLIGGKLLNRIGALALIIGVGLFLKLAFDNNWINEWVRVLIGALVGAGLLVLAAVSHKRGLHIFAQGLVGAGISILYLSVYASFNYYHLIPHMPAFGLMTLVTATAFAHAFRYDSRAVALLAWLGGFLTPFLLSTDEQNELGLFTYIALLDAGILIISLRKTAWTVLEPLALGATWLIYLLWYSSDYAPDSLTLTLYFVAVFWGLFHALTTGKILRGESSYMQLRQVTAAANALFTSCALYSLMDAPHHEWMGAVALFFGGLYGTTAYFLSRSKSEASEWVTEYSSIAIILIVAATAIQFENFTTVSLWAVEALALAWMGSRWQKKHYSVFSFLLFFLAGFTLLGTTGALDPAWGKHATVLFNRRALTYVILAASAWAGTSFFTTMGDKPRAFFSGAISAGAALMVFIMITVETAGYFERLIEAAAMSPHEALSFDRWMTLAVVWSAYGALMLWISLGREDRILYTAGLISLLFGIGAAALRGAQFEPIEEFSFVANWRFGSMIAISLIGFAIVRRLDTDTGKIPWREDIFEVLRVAVVILLLILATGETRDYFRRGLTFARQEAEGTEEITRLQNLQQLSLSGVWLVFSIILMGLGIWRRSRSLRIGSIILFGFTILKIFIYDLSFLDTIYRVVSFIGLGVILLSVSYLYQRYKNVIFDSSDTSASNP